ncbi:MAG: SH3 domain-containing protein [Lacunisphaera sp.]
MKLGANILTAAKKDATVLTVAQEGDKTEVIGLANGDWCQIKLEKKLQGFIAVGANANAPATPALAFNVSGPAAPAAPTADVGHAVPIAGNSADMPRLFAGHLVLARRPIINPNPPYDYQVLDSNGRRSPTWTCAACRRRKKLKPTSIADISIMGTVRNTVDGKDLVIAAESMQLK